MITIGKLIKELQKFPKDIMCFAYEGEVIGVSIIGKNGKYGFVHTGGEGYECKEEKRSKKQSA